jgi:hypothetical protein
LTRTSRSPRWFPSVTRYEQHFEINMVFNILMVSQKTLWFYSTDDLDWGKKVRSRYGLPWPILKTKTLFPNWQSLPLTGPFSYWNNFYVFFQTSLVSTIGRSGLGSSGTEFLSYRDHGTSVCPSSALVIKAWRDHDLQ